MRISLLKWGFLSALLLALPLAASAGVNAFAEFGNCDAPIFYEPSVRSTVQLPAMVDNQSTSSTFALAGNGFALRVDQGSGDRFEGSTYDQLFYFLTGTDVQFQFYYRFPTTIYSYPRMALRQTPDHADVNQEVNACAAYIEWINTDWTIDDSWHLFQPDISTLNWDGVTTGDFFTNTYGIPVWYLDELSLTDPTPANAFSAFGDCEAAIFTEPSVRGSYQGQALADAQSTSATWAVSGQALRVDQGATSRFEASTDDHPVFFSGTDVVFQFYYRFPTTIYSYPRMALRQDPDHADVNQEVNACANYVEWINTDWTIDDNWHLFRPDISALNWDGVANADFFTNTYGVVTWYLDEMSLADPTPPTAGVNDWGLF